MQTRRGAFTLIELLVVMSIIALLITIFVPQIPAIMNYYRVHVTRSIVLQIETGVNQYEQVYKAYPYDLARMNPSGTAMRNGDTDGGLGWGAAEGADYGSCRGYTSIHLMLQGPDGTGWRPAAKPLDKVRSFGPVFDSPGFSYNPPSGEKPYFVDAFGRAILYMRAKLDSQFEDITVTNGHFILSTRYLFLNNFDQFQGESVLQRGADELSTGSLFAMKRDVAIMHWEERLTRSLVNNVRFPENPKTFVVWAAGGDERFGYWAWSKEHSGYICDKYPNDQGKNDGVIGTCDDILSSGDR